jgi:S-DNA-T family DNA segregation ATPase FtsK/SpoIIIE
MAKRKKKREARKVKRKIPERVKQIIIGAISLFLALFFLFAFFEKAGLAGQWVVNLFVKLVGEAIFLFPLMFLVIGITFIFFALKYKRLIVLACLVFVLATSGILATFELKKAEVFRFSLLKSGGWLGTIFAWPLIKFFGFWVTGIFFLILELTSFALLWYLLYRPQKEKKKEKKKVIGEKPATQKIINVKKVFAPKFKVKSIEEVVPPMVVSEEKRKAVKEFKPKIEVTAEAERGKLPPLELLDEEKEKAKPGDIQTNSQIIKRTLENFGISVEMTGANVGPTVTQYTLKPAEGIKLSRITALASNLALALAAHPIRIEAPIPGKSLVGIEVPNQKRALVRLRNLLSQPEFQNAPSPLTFALGRDVVGEPVFADLSRMPHLLIAGSTGTGKTIALNAIILSLLYKNTPKTLRFILVDPKRVEFTAYNHLPHLLAPVIYDADKTVNALKWLIREMERRFEIFSEVGARNIYSFNKKLKKNSKIKKEGFDQMPFIVLIIDELADLMAARARDVEAGIVRLAQKARATGIHLILATQRPSVEVITGLIKANIIARIAFQVASQIDSRTILDMAGAEKLLGNGDMLFISSSVSKPRRIQGAYVSEKEIVRVSEFISQNQQIRKIDELAESLEEDLQKERIEEMGEVFSREEDPLYEEAKRLVIETKKASASFLQRRLRIGYARAARLLDMMEERGIVGPARGAKPREVYGERGNLTEEEPASETDFGNDYNEDIE